MSKSGINFEGTDYWDPILVPGRQVQIHYGNDRRTIEVYDEGQWVARVKMADQATIEDLGLLLELRNDDRKDRSQKRTGRRRSKQIRVTSRTGEGGTSRLVSGMSAEEVKGEINERLRPDAARPSDVAAGLRLDEDGNRVPRNA